jgi:hypothetical protein
MKTTTIESKFHLCGAKSKDTKDYEDGETPFVTSAETNNGIVRCVEPLDEDRVFSGPCVVISGLGFATFQTGNFLPKGNGGDSCSVLYAKEESPVSQYIALASAFNVLHKWRFSYGRKCGKNRIAKLEVPWPLPEIKQPWGEEVTEIEDALKVFSGDIEKNVQTQLPEFAREPVEDTPKPVPS